MATLAGVGVSWLVSTSQRNVQICSGLALLVLIGGLVLIDLRGGQLRIRNIKYYILASYAGFLGVGMVLDVWDQNYSFHGYAILLTFASLFCFLAGFFWLERQVTETAQGHPSFLLSPGQLFAVAVTFYVIGFGLLYLEWHLFGQLQTYSGRLVSSRGIATPPLPMLHVFTQLIAPASLLAMILLRRGTSPVRKCVLAVFLLATVVWYLLWGVRANFLALGVGCLIVWAELPNRHGHRGIGVLPLVVLGFAALVIIALGQMRTHWDFSRTRADGLGGLRQQTSASLNIFRELRQTLEFFPKRVDFLQGYSFYGVVASVVPRVWWEDKPVGIGKLTSILYDRNASSSIALSLPGELYANFGTLGALAGMILFGLLAGKMYRWYSRQRGNMASLAVYIQLIWCMMGETRGDILDATAPLLYHVLPMVVVFAGITQLNKLSVGLMQAASSDFSGMAGAIR